MTILMKMLGKILSAVVVFLAATATAEIKSIKIQSDKRPNIVFEQFAFTHTGHVSISVSSPSVSSSPSWFLHSEPDPSRLGFFMLPSESLGQQYPPPLCPLDSKFTFFLFTFKDLAHHPHSFVYNVTYPGNYIIQFANCNPASLVTMDVRLEVYNTDASTSTKDFLSAGQTQLPYIYFIFALIHFCFLGIWVLVCFKNRHQPYFRKIHILMAVLLVVTVLNLLIAAADRGHVKLTGTPHGWNVLFYISQFFRSVVLSLLIVLIGAGWSFLKPLQLQKDIMVLLILFILECFSNVASIMMRETGPFDKHWETWINVYFVAQIIWSIVIHVPIFFTMDWFHEACKADAKAATTLPEGYLFAVYLFLVFSYAFSKLFFWNEKKIDEKEYRWVYNTGTNSAEEIINLLFYMLMFYMFRPAEENKYFVLDHVIKDELEVPESAPEEDFVLVCISRRKYEEATKMGLWDEEDVLSTFMSG